MQEESNARSTIFSQAQLLAIKYQIAICTRRGMAVSGNKAELIARILQSNTAAALLPIPIEQLLGHQWFLKPWAKNNYCLQDGLANEENIS